MLATKQNQPTYMRYARVQHVLAQELAFKGRLTAKSEAVFKPDGSTELFSPEVIKVTQAIHDSGKDAHKCQKIEVIRAAVKVFSVGENPVPEAHAENGSAAEPEAAPAPRNRTVQAAPQRKPVPKPKPAPKVVKPKVEAAPAPVPVPPPAPPPTPPTPPPPAPPVAVQAPVESTPKVDKDVVVKAAVDAMMSSRPENTAPFNAYISMYSLTLNIIQLCEMYDNQPGAKDRLKNLEQLVSDFHKYTSSKSAKESQKA